MEASPPKDAILRRLKSPIGKTSILSGLRAGASILQVSSGAGTEEVRSSYDAYRLHLTGKMAGSHSRLLQTWEGKTVCRFNT